MKVLAFHLPQYHVFRENSEWWGENFTDWVNLRKSTPRYKGHNQPRIPLDENYYDMASVKTLKWQAKLLNKYGIYGFCYYHYWFDGKILMEKPCELLLDHPDINQNYCFCWANEPWTRSWDGKSREVIMPQKYGDKKEWEEHFQYLLPFFQDKRYIKENNAPVFVIYRTNNVDKCNEMIEYWSHRCKEHGFSGIYLIEEINTFQKEPVCVNASAVLEFEPLYTNMIQDSILLKIHRKVVNAVTKILKRDYASYSYNLTWKAILRRKHDRFAKPIFPGAFVGWDNSPRRKNGATMILGSPKKFKKYFKMQVRNAIDSGTEFVFLNAWNEWAEGAYLEPDNEYGYGYLEVLGDVLNK